MKATPATRLLAYHDHAYVLRDLHMEIIAVSLLEALEVCASHKRCVISLHGKSAWKALEVRRHLFRLFRLPL